MSVAPDGRSGDDTETRGQREIENRGRDSKDEIGNIQRF